MYLNGDFLLLYDNDKEKEIERRKKITHTIKIIILNVRYIRIEALLFRGDFNKTESNEIYTLDIESR